MTQWIQLINAVHAIIAFSFCILSENLKLKLKLNNFVRIVELYSGFVDYFLSTNWMISKWMCIKHHTESRSICLLISARVFFPLPHTQNKFINKYLYRCVLFWTEPKPKRSEYAVHRFVCTKTAKYRLCVSRILRAWACLESFIDVMWNKITNKIIQSKTCSATQTQRRATFNMYCRSAVYCMRFGLFILFRIGSTASIESH